MDDTITCPPPWAEVAICVDCVMAVTYGPAFDEIGDEWPGLLPHWQGVEFVVARTADDGEPVSDPSFSWSPCGGCGDGLGGDRYDYLALLAETAP